MKPPRYRIKIARADFERLCSLVEADLPLEGAAFGLTGVVSHAHGVDLLVRRVIEIPREMYDAQMDVHLEVAPKAVNGLAALCETNRLGALVCHSHSVRAPYSASDDFGEERLYKALAPFMPPEMPLASLLVAPGALHARVWTSAGVQAVAEVVILGSHLERVRVGRRPESHIAADRYSRQVLALGQQGQGALAAARVAVVGVGGTGSPSAEQLIRLGVSDLTLIDPDTLEASNLSRVYGSTAADLKRRVAPTKVEVLARHLRRINPEVTVTPISASVVTRAAALALVDRDAILLCTDEHWGRSVVNQVAYQYMVPTVNLGLSLRREGDQLLGAGVIDVLRPDVPCLWCRQFLDGQRIAAESLPLEHRAPLVEEGYLPDPLERAPSVVSMTTTVSGLGVTAFLQLITGFMGAAGDVHRLNYDPTQGTVRRGRSQIDPTCICQRVRGAGDCRVLPTTQPESQRTKGRR